MSDQTRVKFIYNDRQVRVFAITKQELEALVNCWFQRDRERIVRKIVAESEMISPQTGARS